MKKIKNIFYSITMFLAGASYALADFTGATLGVPGQPSGGYNTGGVPQTPNSVAGMACIVTKLALSFIPYLIVIAVAGFLRGLVKYVGHGDNEEKRTEGIKMMIYGTLGFFFIVGVWGILRLFTGSFGLPLVVPQFKANQSFICN